MTDMDRAGGERAARYDEERACPFCREDGFDGVGLKVHLSSGHCETYEATPSPARTVRLYAHPPAPAGGEGKGGPTSDSAVRLGDLGRVVGPLIDAWEQMPNDLRDERLDRRMGALLAFMEDHRATPAERAAAGLGEEERPEPCPSASATAEGGGERHVVCQQASCSTQGVTRSAGPWRCAIHHPEHPANAHPSPDAGGVGEAKAGWLATIPGWARGIIETVGSSEPSFEDPRVGYVEIQIERSEWEEARALAAKGGDDPRRGESGEAIAAQGGGE